jgi:hypothetical protein
MIGVWVSLALLSTIVFVFYVFSLVAMGRARRVKQHLDPASFSSLYGSARTRSRHGQ